MYLQIVLSRNRCNNFYMKKLLCELKVAIRKKIKDTLLTTYLRRERFHEHDFNTCKPNETLKKLNPCNTCK